MRLGSVVGSALLFSSLAHAQAYPVVATSVAFVRLPGAEACPDSRALQTRIERRLGRAVLVMPAHAERAVEASISPNRDGGYRVAIALFDASGERLGTRELDVAGQGCEPAAEATSLAIALMIDPDALSRSSFPDSAAPSPAPTAPPRPVLASAPAPCAAAERPTSTEALKPRSTWGTRLSVGGALRGGALPGIAPGAWVAWRVLPLPNWGFSIGGAYLPPQRQRLTGDAGVELSLQSADAGAWWLTKTTESLSLGLGTAFVVGSTLANGYGFTRNRAARSWLVGAQLSVELRYALSRPVALVLRPSLEATLWSNDYTGTLGTESVPIYEPSVLRPGILLGIELGP